MYERNRCELREIGVRHPKQNYKDKKKEQFKVTPKFRTFRQANSHPLTSMYIGFSSEGSNQSALQWRESCNGCRWNHNVSDWFHSLLAFSLSHKRDAYTGEVGDEVPQLFKGLSNLGFQNCEISFLLLSNANICIRWKHEILRRKLKRISI